MAVIVITSNPKDGTEIYDSLAQRTAEPIKRVVVSAGGAVIVTSVHGITTHYISIDLAGYEWEPVVNPVKPTQRTYGPPRKGRTGKIKKW